MYQKVLKTLLPLFVATLLFSVITSCDSSSTDAADPQPSLAIDNKTLTFDSNTTATITATAKKADGTNDTITAVSSDVTSATVSVTDLAVTVTGIKAGTPTITITSGSGLSETCVTTLNASWHTVVFDDFNRANSSIDSSGSNWIVFPGSNPQIIDNHLFINQIADVGAVGALYNQSISDNYIRVSGTVNFNVCHSIVFLFRFDDEAGGIGYGAGYTSSAVSIAKFSSDDPEILVNENFPCSAEVPYLFEIIAHDTNLTFNLKDNNGNLLKTVSVDDDSFLSGKAGVFTNPEFVGSSNIDNFKIETFH